MKSFMFFLMVGFGKSGARHFSAFQNLCGDYFLIHGFWWSWLSRSTSRCEDKMMAHWGCKAMHQLGKLILSSWPSFRQLVQRYAGRIVCWCRFLFKGWCSNPNEKYLKVKFVLCDEWHRILGAFMLLLDISNRKKPWTQQDNLGWFSIFTEFN